MKLAISDAHNGLKAAVAKEGFPQLAAMMIETEHQLLTFMDFPKEHRAKIHSTNVLECLNGEYPIRQRYTSLVSLVTMSENPAIRLPAAPAWA